MTDADRCRKNGWDVGTKLVGIESGSEGSTTTTIQLTAIGEHAILAKMIRSVTTSAAGERATSPEEERCWTLTFRDWKVAP